MFKTSTDPPTQIPTGRLRRRLVTGLLGVAMIPASVVGVAYAMDDNTISACVSDQTGAIRKVESTDDCRNQESPLEWAKQGPAGPQGLQGPQGPQGPAAASSFVVRQSAPVAVPPEGPIVGDAHVFCRPGERATGGGGLPSGPAPGFYNTVLLASFPTVSGQPATDGQTANGWFVRARNNGEGSQVMELIAYVICAPA